MDLYASANWPKKNTKVVVNVAIKIFSVDKNYINHISKKNHIHLVYLGKVLSPIYIRQKKETPVASRKKTGASD